MWNTSKSRDSGASQRGIVPEPPGQAIAEPRASAAPHERQTAPAPDHGRAKACGFDLSCGDRREMLEQHVGNQIHAVPFLFAEIADDADAQRFHRRRRTNQACVARRGPSQVNGLASTRSTSNCRARRSLNAIQLNPL